MRIVCEGLGELEINYPLTPIGFDEFELAEEDLMQLDNLIWFGDWEDNVRGRNYESLICSCGVKRAVIVGYDGADKTPYWGLLIELYMPLDMAKMFETGIEDYAYFVIRDGLSVVQVNYHGGIRIFLSHDVGWALPCTVTGYAEGRIQLETPKLTFADGRAVSTQASLLQDEDGYLVTHYLDYGDGVLRPREERLEGHIIQSVVIWQGK